jgi:hypothetical protein
MGPFGAPCPTFARSYVVPVFRVADEVSAQKETISDNNHGRFIDELNPVSLLVPVTCSVEP